MEKSEKSDSLKNTKQSGAEAAAGDGSLDLEREEIQGIIVYGYGHLPETRYLLMQFREAAAAKAWLGELAAVVSDSMPAADRADLPPVSINVALTAAGLRVVCPDDSGDSGDSGDALLQTFPEEFQDGMSRPARARTLGDNGSSDPRRWEFGGTVGDAAAPDTAREPHALLLLFAADAAHMTQLYDREKARWEAAGSGIVLLQEETQVTLREKEHFGFRDGIANPVIAGTREPGERGEIPLCAGEFILGYPNEYQTYPFTPTVSAEWDVTGVLPPARAETSAGTHTAADTAGSRAQAAGRKDLGRNGSYLVYRKLEQDVAGFWRCCAAQAAGADSADSAEWVAAKMVGRWPNGAPLVLRPDADDTALGGNADLNDDFLYAERDPHGFRCPLGAHIRRANPRDHLVGDAANPADRDESLVVSSRHRILRRGRPYGPPLENPRSGVDDGRKRGLIFIGIVANISRQFEFVQQTWLNNPKFHGLYSDRDPISGDNFEPVLTDRAGAIDIPCRFTIPQPYVRRRLLDVPRFVTVRGGAYFFVPGISALCFLAGVPRPPRTQ